MEEKELSLDELDNVLPGKAGIEKALEHPELYRKKMIDELKQERDAILSSTEYQEASSNTQAGRSK